MQSHAVQSHTVTDRYGRFQAVELEELRRAHERVAKSDVIELRGALSNAVDQASCDRRETAV